MRYVSASYAHIPYTCTLVQLINILVIKLDYLVVNWMLIDYVNYIAYKISRSIKYLLWLDWWLVWWIKWAWWVVMYILGHGGLSCTFWGKLSKLHSLASMRRKTLHFIYCCFMQVIYILVLFYNFPKNLDKGGWWWIMRVVEEIWEGGNETW